jgi:hypothetical protein
MIRRLVELFRGVKVADIPVEAADQVRASNQPQDGESPWARNPGSFLVRDDKVSSSGRPMLGPHVMVVGPRMKSVPGYDRTGEGVNTATPYVMWTDTPYEHMRVLDEWPPARRSSDAAPPVYVGVAGVGAAEPMFTSDGPPRN